MLGVPVVLGRAPDVGVPGGPLHGGATGVLHLEARRSGSQRSTAAIRVEVLFKNPELSEVFYGTRRIKQQG